MIYTLTIIIAFISFFAGISTDFFGWAKPEYVPTGALSIAILAILIGDRFEDSRREDKRQSTLDNYLLSKPSLNVITEFQDAESAMEYLASRYRFPILSLIQKYQVMELTQHSELRQNMKKH